MYREKVIPVTEFIKDKKVPTYTYIECQYELANDPTHPRDKPENPWAGFAGFLNNGFYGTFGFFKNSQFLANLRHFRQFFNCFRSSGHNYCLLVHLKWYKTRIGKCQDFLYHGTVEE